MNKSIDPSTNQYAVIGIRTHRNERSLSGLGLVWTKSAIGHLLQHSVAAAIVFLYSKNILSAAVRALVSF